MDGRATGLIVMEPRERFARDGAVYVTLPTGERERLQGVEAAMRVALSAGRRVATASSPR